MRIKSIRTTIATAAFLLLTSLNLQASPSLLVYGNVWDSNGVPLAGVRLTLQTSNVTRIITTAADGSYGFLSESVPTPVDHNYTLTPVLANYTFSPPYAALYLDPGGTPVYQSFYGTLGTLTSSPLDTAEFFVRQQYVDLLKHEPDEGGLNFWSADLKACTTQACRNEKRRNIMCAFIASGDYQARFVGTSITVCQ